MGEVLNITEITEYLKTQVRLHPNEAENGTRYCFYSENDAILYVGELFTNRSRTKQCFNLSAGAKLVMLNDGHTEIIDTARELSTYDFKVYELKDVLNSIL